MHQHLAALLAEMIVLTLAVHKAAMPAFPAATDDLVTGKGSAAGEEKEGEHCYFFLYLIFSFETFVQCFEPTFTLGLGVLNGNGTTGPAKSNPMGKSSLNDFFRFHP